MTYACGLNPSAELEKVAGELGQSMAAVAVNWVANRPGVASVLIGATKLSQLQSNLQALTFSIPTELASRLERASRPDQQFPYSFFEPEIQGMIQGGKPVGNKPPGYQPLILIEGAGSGV